MNTQPKPGRNDLCPCKSGKKFKKCCIDKESFLLPQLPIEAKSSFVHKYPAKELLQVLSLIQLQPENYGKNLRLESLITQLLQKPLRMASDFIDLEKLAKDLGTVEGTLNEDPPEDFFTDNIIYFDGNHVIYPGIFLQSAHIVQNQLNALKIMPPTEDFLDNYAGKIHCGIRFLLKLFDSIAEHFGHTRQLFREGESDSLFIPSPTYLRKHMDVMRYSKAQLENLCQEVNAPIDLFEQFVFRGEPRDLSVQDLNDNPLFKTPLVRIGEDYILVFPTAQTAAMCHYITAEIQKAGMAEEFAKAHAMLSENSFDIEARKMGWKPARRSGFPTRHMMGELLVTTSFYDIDINKQACVLTATMVPVVNRRSQAQSRSISDGFGRYLSGLVKKLSADATYEFFMVTVYDGLHVFSDGFISMSPHPFFKVAMAIKLEELQVMNHNWKLGALDLYRYARAEKQARKHMKIMSANSHLSRYNWYERNGKSFNPSDDARIHSIGFGIEIEGDIRRNSLRKRDFRGIPCNHQGTLYYKDCLRIEPHIPIYISMDIQYGVVRRCLLLDEFPIWVYIGSNMTRSADIYVNAIIYWLFMFGNDLYSFLRPFKGRPVSIELDFDQTFGNKENWVIDGELKDIQINYSISASDQTVQIVIPGKIIAHMSRIGNLGEQLLMRKILEILSEMRREISGEEADFKSLFEQVIAENMADQQRKMILLSEVSDDMTMADFDTDHHRVLSEADSSTILESQLDELMLNSAVPRDITGDDEKKKILNALVAHHFNRIKELLKAYDAIELVQFLMKRHEDLIFYQSTRKMRVVAEIACYAHLYDVYSVFSEEESDLVTASLAHRTLIEFTICEMPQGNLKPNHADIDIILAHVNHLVNYGAFSDFINFGIDSPKMGRLPSGRLGIDRKELSWLNAFVSEMHDSEVYHSKQNFDGRFYNEHLERPTPVNNDDYLDKVDSVFIEEWGITLWNIRGLAQQVAYDQLKAGKSVDIVKESWLYERYGQKDDSSKGMVRNFLQKMTFQNRKGILDLPKNSQHDAYPWRFNRPISYLLKPLIRFERDGQFYYIISARHLCMAAENLIAQFLDGTLKVDAANKGLQTLLAERNNIKGQKYRDDVLGWIKKHTKLQVFDQEIKIKKKGFFIADDDKGDIDILAIDHEKRIIYAIECKNTAQPKIAYDIHVQVSQYLGKPNDMGLIQKHINRHKWLLENRQQVEEKLGVAMQGYDIFSMVLTKNILPKTKALKVEMPIFTYYELIHGRVF